MSTAISLLRRAIARTAIISILRTPIRMVVIAEPLRAFIGCLTISTIPRPFMESRLTAARPLQRFKPSDIDRASCAVGTAMLDPRRPLPSCITLLGTRAAARDTEATASAPPLVVVVCGVIADRTERQRNMVDGPFVVSSTVGRPIEIGIAGQPTTMQLLRGHAIRVVLATAVDPIIEEAAMVFTAACPPPVVISIIIAEEYLLLGRRLGTKTSPYVSRPLIDTAAMRFVIKFAPMVFRPRQARPLVSGHGRLNARLSIAVDPDPRFGGPQDDTFLAIMGVLTP